MVTILAALAIGYSVGAAVEFSFLLGLLTLGAATAFDLVRHGKELFDTYGVLNPFLGFLFAFLFAVVAIRWMVTYLRHHGLEIFGWYRLFIAGVALVLLITGAV
jgi:undecaprenyl-diphosphatase